MCYTEGINTLPKGGYRNLHAEIVCSKTPKNMKPLDNDTSPNGIKHKVADLLLREKFDAISEYLILSCKYFYFIADL